MISEIFGIGCITIGKLSAEVKLEVTISIYLQV